MMFTFHLLPWLLLAYVFRAQIPVVFSAIKTDIAWVRSFFAKAPPAAPVKPVETTPANSNTA